MAISKNIETEKACSKIKVSNISQPLVDLQSAPKKLKQQRISFRSYYIQQRLQQLTDGELIQHVSLELRNYAILNTD